MGVSDVLYTIGHFLCRPFADCSSCCDVLDRHYYYKTSPGGHTSPQMFNRWPTDVKHTAKRSRPLPSRPPVSKTHVGVTKRSTSSSSRARSESSSNNPSSSNYDDDDERDRHVQFLFYGGSDPPTPTSRGGLASVGYRSDLISDTGSRAPIQSPQINREIPCFFSPRQTPRSSLSMSMYSPHVFKITEHQTRRNARYRSMRSFR
ncbi:unnamed protein product [Hyaloperonospora brassicae]|uniref:RxLR effector candidate protein n=1 Tax=Hyaloperonospora brassicae TaxID=162125 RepID=A0AAV0UC73_HYABA|nr:unnamed protein product [Hyaloperonospora brassicae]